MNKTKGKITIRNVLFPPHNVQKKHDILGFKPDDLKIMCVVPASKHNGCCFVFFCSHYAGFGAQRVNSIP